MSSKQEFVSFGLAAAELSIERGVPTGESHRHLLTQIANGLNGASRSSPWLDDTEKTLRCMQRCVGQAVMECPASLAEIQAKGNFGSVVTDMARQAAIQMADERCSMDGMACRNKCIGRYLAGGEEYRQPISLSCLTEFLGQGVEVAANGRILPDTSHLKDRDVSYPFRCLE